MPVGLTPHNLRAVADRFLRDATHDPAWRSVLAPATILVLGSPTAGLADRYSDVDLQAILPDARYADAYRTAVRAGRIEPGERLVTHVSDRQTLDGRRPLCAIELRSTSALTKTLEDELPVELWLMTHAWVIQDPGGQVGEIVSNAHARFTAQLETLTSHELGHVHRRHRWLAIAARRGQLAGEAILAGNLVRSAMRLACLLDDSPVPYDKWLVAWTVRNTRLGARLEGHCLDLLLHRTDHTDMRVAANRVLAAATAAARQRWPHATWVTRPDHFGEARS